MLFESLGEIERAGESNLIGNLGECLLGVFEKLAGLSQAERLQIPVRWLAGLSAKKRRETRPRIPGTPGHFLNSARAAQLGRHVIYSLGYPGLPVCVALAGVASFAVEQRTLPLPSVWIG